MNLILYRIATKSHIELQNASELATRDLFSEKF